MDISGKEFLSRRGFCLCCLGGAATAAVGGWLTPREAFAEARGLVSLIKDSAAVSPITTYRLRKNISVLEGSGGTVAVLTGTDGKVLIDAGIGVSRPQMTSALANLGSEPITHLINTHWHFDHADGNTWLNAAGAKIIAQENTRKYLSQVQRVEDWDYNFLALPAAGIPTDVFAEERSLKLNGLTIALKQNRPRPSRQVRQIRDRSRLLHEIGLRRRLSRSAAGIWLLRRWPSCRPHTTSYSRDLRNEPACAGWNCSSTAAPLRFRH
jgi:hypothetical protein